MSIYALGTVKTNALELLTQDVDLLQRAIRSGTVEIVGRTESDRVLRVVASAGNETRPILVSVDLAQDLGLLNRSPLEL